MARSNKLVEPKAENKLDKMKYEIAQEEGIDLKHGYNGDLTSREAGKIGGNMVKKMIEYAEKNMNE